MTHAEEPLFYSSLLLFSEQSMDRIARSTVGAVGMGGVGAIATELLARAGVGSFKVADPDVHEPSNLNRQLFATRQTLGQNKARCARDRLLSINPQCSIVLYETGIGLANAAEFCSGIDLLLCQCDKESTKIVLHRVAREARIPVVAAARASIHDDRWKVRARVWNYRDAPGRACYDEVYHPQMVGVPLEQMTEETLADFDRSTRAKDRGVFDRIARTRPELFASIAPEDLRDRIDRNPTYGNRHVCGVIAATAGSLAATAALKLLVGGPWHDLEVSLWDEETGS